MAHEDDDFLARVREAYTPPPVDPARFDAALQARLDQPSRRPWVWVGLATAAAAAIALFVLTRPAATPVEHPGIASNAPVESAGPLLAELDIESDLVVDEVLDGLPDDYVELADYLEL